MGTPVNAAISCWIGFSSPMSSRGSRHRAPPGAAAAAASGAGEATAQRKGPKKEENDEGLAEKKEKDAPRFLITCIGCVKLFTLILNQKMLLYV